jgi:hypothetical protein
MNDITTQPGVQGSVYLLALILLYHIKFRLILMQWCYSRGGKLGEITLLFSKLCSEDVHTVWDFQVNHNRHWVEAVELVGLDEPVRDVRNSMPFDASLAETCQEVI